LVTGADLRAVAMRETSRGQELVGAISGDDSVALPRVQDDRATMCSPLRAADVGLCQVVKSQVSVRSHQANLLSCAVSGCWHSAVVPSAVHGGCGLRVAAPPLEPSPTCGGNATAGSSGGLRPSDEHLAGSPSTDLAGTASGLLERESVADRVGVIGGHSFRDVCAGVGVSSHGSCAACTAACGGIAFGHDFDVGDFGAATPPSQPPAPLPPCGARRHEPPPPAGACSVLAYRPWFAWQLCAALASAGHAWDSAAYRGVGALTGCYSTQPPFFRGLDMCDVSLGAAIGDAWHEATEGGTYWDFPLVQLVRTMLLGARVRILSVRMLQRSGASLLVGLVFLEVPFAAELSSTLRPFLCVPARSLPTTLLLSQAHLVGIPPFGRAATTPAGGMASRPAIFLAFGSCVFVRFVAA
jgi:hypothetical protein